MGIVLRGHAARPGLHSTYSMTIPVLIIGGGPVGLMLAGDLGWRGVPCTLIERGDGSIDQPKMDMVGIRTMEFCRRWGIAQAVENAGYNRDYPQDNVWLTDLHGYELGREHFPPPRQERAPPQSPQKRERCPQNFFDPVLKRFASQYAHVALCYDTALRTFEEHDDCVIATVEDVKSGETREVQASYLIGCDGAASSVRQQLNIPMLGDPVLTYSTNILFRCADFDRLHPKAPGYRHIFIGPEGAWATLVAINGRDQWRFSIIGDAEKRTRPMEECRAAIFRAMGKPFAFDILSVVPWVRRQLVAASYGTRRVFLSGDACHVTSPTGGFGMNTGAQDAVDLGWKLEAMLGGWGGRDLLCSYELERRPVAVQNVAEATGNLQRMLTPRHRSPPQVLFQAGAVGDAARKQFGADFTEIMKREWFTLGIHLGYRYEGSPIVVADGTPEPPNPVSSYIPTARPGHRAPHLWLGPHHSTLDLFGRGYTLLRFHAGADSADSLFGAARSRGMPLGVVDVQNEEAAHLYQSRFVLVRPDGHVAWRGDSLPRDPLAVIDIVRGGGEVRQRSR